MGAPLEAGAPSGIGMTGSVKSPATGAAESAVICKTLVRNWARVRIPLAVKQYVPGDTPPAGAAITA